MAAAAVLALCATMLLGLAVPLWLATGAAAAGVGLGLPAAATGLAAAVCARHSRSANREAQARLEEAWAQVARELLQRRPRTADELAAAIGTDLVHAEALLARLAAEGRARVAVREDAELAYSGVEVASTEGDPGAMSSACGARG
jgi:hypothetical protein